MKVTTTISFFDQKFRVSINVRAVDMQTLNNKLVELAIISLSCIKLTLVTFISLIENRILKVQLQIAKVHLVGLEKRLFLCPNISFTHCRKGRNLIF